MFALADTIRRTQTEDGGILLDIHHGQMFSLNAVGSQMIELLEKGFDEGQIAAHVARAYAADIETIRADVRDFIAVLKKHHILQVRSAGAVT
jgi:hypothetical protein